MNAPWQCAFLDTSGCCILVRAELKGEIKLRNWQHYMRGLKYVYHSYKIIIQCSFHNFNSNLFINLTFKFLCNAFLFYLVSISTKNLNISFTTTWRINKSSNPKKKKENKQVKLQHLTMLFVLSVHIKINEVLVFTVTSSYYEKDQNSPRVFSSSYDNHIDTIFLFSNFIFLCLTFS